MINRDDVVYGLLHCRAEYCNESECPYYNTNFSHERCRTLLHDEALKLIREFEKSQEPRVLTLEEVIAHYSLPPVFVDDFEAQEDYYEDIQPLYFEFTHDNDGSWIVHWRGYSQVASYLDGWKYSYNKKWRCWSSRPTDELRKSVPWDADD